jgi:hypothetical protein
MSRSDNPKVFISYAGEDEERFVRPFAERLRANGVDTWVAFWDMLPGDKLVSKIFDEGLRPSDAVIVILSKFSVDKPWVKDELHYAKVRQIEEKVRLIPVKIEPCDIPECVRTTLWEEIADQNNYDRQFERIVNSIFGQYEKPPLGPKPAYVRPDVLTMDGLTRIDSVILEHACRIAIEQGHSVLISGDRLVSELAAQGISEAQIMESEEVLEGRYCVRIHRVMGPPHAYDFAITTAGFDKFAQVGIPEYGKLCAEVARLLVREEHQSNTGVAQALSQPIRIIEHIFESLEHHGLIKFQTSHGGGGLDMYVYWVSPELRRKLEGSG